VAGHQKSALTSTSVFCFQKWRNS